MNNDDERLALYVNDRLEGTQRQRMQDAIADDPELAREVELLRMLKQGWQQDQEAPPMELGLARLKRDIQQEQSLPEAPSPRYRGQRFWKGLALAACLVVAIQASLVVFTGSDDTQWELLSGSPEPDAPRLQVVFTPDTTIAQLQALLQPHAAHIVEGPGALGIYTLRLPEDSDAVDIRDQLLESALVEEVNLP